MLFLWLIQHGLRIFLKAVDRIIAAGTRIYRTRWSFFVAWSRRCRACGTVRMNQPSEGERAGQREIEADRDRPTRKGTRKKESGEGEDGKRTRERKREGETGTKRWALEWAVLQIAPPALETPATTSCSSRGSSVRLKSAEFLTRARTSNDRDVIGAGPAPGSPV